MSLKDRIESEEVTLSMAAGESGKLFGSVNNAMIAEELEKKGIVIDRRRIVIADQTITVDGRTGGNRASPSVSSRGSEHQQEYVHGPE